MDKNKKYYIAFVVMEIITIIIITITCAMDSKAETNIEFHSETNPNNLTAIFELVSGNPVDNLNGTQNIVYMDKNSEKNILKGTYYTNVGENTIQAYTKTYNAILPVKGNIIVTQTVYTGYGTTTGTAEYKLRAVDQSPTVLYQNEQVSISIPIFIGVVFGILVMSIIKIGGRR